MSDVTVVDIDSDGYADIVSACQYAQCPGQIFYGNGQYQFTPNTVTALDFPYVIGDFNGDGLPDIATGSHVLFNAGGRTFRSVAANTLPMESGSLAVVGDFNGDGKDDVAVNSPGDMRVLIYYSKGDGTFYQAVSIDLGQYPGALVAGDFDGDGRTDLAAGLMYSQQACILFNTGQGTFSRSYFASGAFVVGMVGADLNRNGKVDLVIGNFALDYEPPNVNVVFHK